MNANRIISITLFIILVELSNVILTQEQWTTNSTESLISDTYNKTEIDEQILGNFSEQFIYCPKATIDPGHFQMLENKSVYVPNYATYSQRGLYPPGEYLLYGNSVLVCYPITLVEKNKKETSMEMVLSYVTIIGLSMSIVCLTLHLVAFLLVPEMKNLPGKNLAALSVSLVMSNVIFLIGRIEYTYSWTCYPLGLANYYFMMSSFFWINSISFNVFRSIRQAITKLRLSKHDKIKRFFFYSLYSWGLPVIFLIAVIIGDETDAYPQSLKPGFKEEFKCWFTRVWSAVVFFVVPFGVLLFLNALSFVFSASIISSSVKTDNDENGKRKKFSLYLKLAVIMGLGWIFALITHFVNSVYIKFFTVVIVTFQGVFIFVAFTRFTKTKDGLQQRYFRFRKSMASFSTFQTEDSRFSTKKSSSTTTNSISSYRIKSEDSKPRNDVKIIDFERKFYK